MLRSFVTRNAATPADALRRGLLFYYSKYIERVKVELCYMMAMECVTTPPKRNGGGSMVLRGYYFAHQQKMAPL